MGAPLARNRRLLRVRPLRHRRNHRRRVRAETPTERAPLPPVPGAERKEFSRAPSDSWRPASLVRSQSGLAHRWPICWLAGRPARVARSGRPLGQLATWAGRQFGGLHWRPNGRIWGADVGRPACASRADGGGGGSAKADPFGLRSAEEMRARGERTMRLITGPLFSLAGARVAPIKTR